VAVLCEIWSLPALPPYKGEGLAAPKAKAKAKAKGRPRTKTSAPAPPSASGSKHATIPTAEEWNTYLQPEQWDSPAGGIKHIIDSQTVEGWVNGRSKIVEDHVDQLAGQIYEHVAIMNNDRVYQNQGLICEWRRRAYNVEADWACNAALDAQSAFFWHDPEALERATHANITFHSDGGKREVDPAAPDRKLTATGWAVRVHSGAGSSLAAMGGIVHDNDLTVPQLELRAIRDVYEHWEGLQQGYEPEAPLRSIIILDNLLPAFRSSTPETE